MFCKGLPLQSGNDFGDGKTGTISGTVKDYNSNPLGLVIIQLKKFTGTVVLRTTATGGDGACLFSNVLPGTYSLFETNPA